MIYGATPCDDGTFVITGSPDTTRYLTLQDAMRAVGKLNAAALDEAYASLPDPNPAIFDGDGDLIRRARRSHHARRRA